jgi:hypothetical protein
MIRINLWASPRNLSTALMYSFAQRSDTQVVDEPLYAHYLTQSGAMHPGRAEILASQEQVGKKVVENVMLGEYDKPVAFFKQMTHHLVGLDRSFMAACKNVILIRDPASFIHSYTKVLPHPKFEDIGIAQAWELCQELRAQDKLTAVLDARQIRLNPRKVLSQLCEKLGIPFEEAMLSWPAGPRPEDGVWAPHWYHNVHRSTGFQPYEERAYAMAPHLSELLGQAETYYQRLYPLAIKS